MAAENRFYVGCACFSCTGRRVQGRRARLVTSCKFPRAIIGLSTCMNIPANADHKALGAQNHFSFGVPGNPAAAEQLRKNGVEKIAGPGIGRDGKRGLNVYDPTIRRVEVTEFTPARELAAIPTRRASETMTCPALLAVIAGSEICARWFLRRRRLLLAACGAARKALTGKAPALNLDEDISHSLRARWPHRLFRSPQFQPSI